MNTTADRLQMHYQSPHALRPFPGNAKVHTKAQVRKISRSIERFGFANPVLISDEGEIIAGHGRVEAAKQLGLVQIPTVRLSSLTPADRIAYNLADNRLGELARYDRDLLAVQLDELTSLSFDEIEITGFSLGDIDLRLDESAEKRGRQDAPEHKIPLPRKTVVSRRGDLWLLGPHRLLCGDATVAADVNRLVDGQRVDLVLTDPPWNLPTRYFSGKGRNRHPDFAMARGEMTEGEFTQFLGSFLGLSKQVSKPGAIFFVFMDWRHLYELPDRFAVRRADASLLKAAAAFVVSAGRWISTDDQECFATLEALVPDACADDDHIAGRAFTVRPTLIAAEPKRRRPSRIAQNFVDHRMEVHEVVNAITPSIPPTFGHERLLKHSGRIVPARTEEPVDKRAFANSHRHETSVVPGETHGRRLAPPRGSGCRHLSPFRLSA